MANGRRSRFLSAELVEGHSGGGGDVEGVDPAVHGYAGEMVALTQYAVGQSVAFVAQDDGEVGNALEGRMVDGEGAVGEGEGDGGEACAAELLVVVEVGPGELEDGAHAYAAGAAVERVAGGGCEEQGVDSEGCSGAEDGAGVFGVDDAVDDGEAGGGTGGAEGGEELVGGGQGRAMHAAEDSAAELVAGEVGKQLARSGVDGDVELELVEEWLHLGGDEFFLGQEGEGYATGGKGDAYDFEAFADEESVLGIEAVAELGFGEPGVGRQCGELQGVDGDLLHDYKAGLLMVQARVDVEVVWFRISL